MVRGDIKPDPSKSGFYIFNVREVDYIYAYG